MPKRSGYNWRLAKATKCSRCNGKGSYRVAYGDRKGETVECKGCDGTGRVIPFTGGPNR